MRRRRDFQRHHSGEDLSTLFDILIAIGICAGILLMGRFGIKMLLNAPPEPRPGDVIEVAMDYRCSVCGLHLTVTRAQGEDIAPPRHCHEEMEEAI